MDGLAAQCWFTKAVMADCLLKPNTNINIIAYKQPPVRGSNTIDSLSEQTEFTEADCSEGKVSFICYDKEQPLNTVNVLLLVLTNFRPSGIHHTHRN